MNDRQSQEAQAEAAAIRRRWINLGELLAVIAVLISALTLWLNWSERSDTQAQKTAESSRAEAKAATLTLRAEAGSKDKRLALAPASADQTVQEQTIRFPSALGLAPVQTTGEPRLETRWFDDALVKAREKAGLPDDSRGDERLPVLIETRFLVDGKSHRDVALYDIGYSIKGGMLAGHEVKLRGLSLIRRTDSSGGGAAVEARWQKLVPAEKKD